MTSPRPIANAHAIERAEKRRHHARVEIGRMAGSAPHIRRTHWTPGKHRNDPGDDWPVTLAALRERLAVPVYGVVSIRACAHHVGVNPSSVMRWLDETDLPSAVSARRVKSWLGKVRVSRIPG